MAIPSQASRRDSCSGSSRSVTLSQESPCLAQRPRCRWILTLPFATLPSLRDSRRRLSRHDGPQCTLIDYLTGIWWIYRFLVRNLLAASRCLHPAVCNGHMYLRRPTRPHTRPARPTHSEGGKVQTGGGGTPDRSLKAE